ncbi:MAG TPA: tRNA (adenosine(37)-N6)-dimethylallyltransferase MiaA, partial [Candidatus Saccharimonadales bacterium]|nr:tRNA (adenosine(37)-N6)-dimethylallyltransferase MiaA [Candidatus Saccharimonadales bacterium]
MKKTPLVVVVGATASGKSEMVLELAEKFNGEIICADSRTIYKGMDIGTAKPSSEDRLKIKHHLLDIVAPDEEFNAAEFKRLANRTIEEIKGRGKIPFLAGGTGLYISGVVYDYGFGDKKDPLIRTRLEKETTEDLKKKAKKLALTEDDINFKNRRHLIRAIERGGIIKGDDKLRDNCLILGIDIGQDELKSRIRKRIDRMIKSGLEKEVRKLVSMYSFNAAGMDAICYKEWQSYFAGEQSLAELKEEMYKNTWQYARRQKTWFRRDKNIRWATSSDEASVLVYQF